MTLNGYTRLDLAYTTRLPTHRRGGHHTLLLSNHLSFTLPHFMLLTQFYPLNGLNGDPFKLYLYCPAHPFVWVGGVFTHTF